MRFPLESFLPSVWASAKSFSTNRETQEDLVQEAIIKILRATQNLSEGEDFGSRDWARRIQRIIKNSMIDQIRKINRRSKWTVDLDLEPSQFEGLKSVQAEQFEKLTTEHSVKELMRLLPDLEKRILKEMIDPSEEFCWFSRKKFAIANIFKKRFNERVPNKTCDSIDSTLGEFFNIERPVLRSAIARIKEVASYRRVALFQ